MWHFLWIVFLALANGEEIKTIYSWNMIDYNFPNDNIRNTLISNGDYIEENNMPNGMQIWNDKIFITIPRWKNGVPSNLNFFLKNDGSESPKLNPYPNWEMNDMNKVDSIINIIRVRVDACDRLWGVDMGVNDILGNNTVIYQPRIIIIDLKTDKILRIYPLKSSDQTSDSFFVDLVIDTDPNNCDNTYAYISDLGGYALVVYSWAKNDSWRITHNFFYFDPRYGNYNINGFNFQWKDGLFGLSLSALQTDGYKILYFHAMSSIAEFSVSTEVLQDHTLEKSSDYYAFHFEGEKGPNSQGPSSVIDTNTDVNYFTQINRNGIACWDTNVELNPNTFILVGEDNTTMVFCNDLSIDRSTNTMYVLSDNFQQLLFSKYDVKKRNFFITMFDLDFLTNACKKKDDKPKRRLPHIL